jgi:hypothetical protein
MSVVIIAQQPGHLTLSDYNDLVVGAEVVDGPHLPRADLQW